MGSPLSSDADGVKCEGTCRISGPGTIARTQPSRSGHCNGLVGNYSTISVKDSVLTTNAAYGVPQSGPVKVSDSTVTGNFVDITAGKRPRVSRSTCVTSVGGPGAAPDTWGVCSAP